MSYVAHTTYARHACALWMFQPGHLSSCHWYDSSVSVSLAAAQCNPNPHPASGPKPNPNLQSPSVSLQPTPCERHLVRSKMLSRTEPQYMNDQSIRNNTAGLHITYTRVPPTLRRHKTNKIPHYTVHSWPLTPLTAALECPRTFSLSHHVHSL